MHVTPISPEKADEQSGSFDPWPAGEYDFTVADAGEERSASSGNDMIKLTLHVFDRSGNRRTVFDYLVSTDKGQWKVRHFCDAVSMIRQYESGDLNPMDMLNRSGRLKLRVKPAQNSYPANNAVNDYLPAVAASSQKGANGPAQYVPPGPDLDDQIPF